MNKQLLSCITLCVFFLGCNKKPDPSPTPIVSDTTAPVMLLNGNVKDTVSLNANYVDAGAIATDNIDGNITANIVVSGNLNVNQTGDYVRNYNVSDAAGNAATQLTRQIHVRNDAWFLAGNYAVAPNCGTTPASNYNTSITVSSSVNRQFFFSSLLYNGTGQTPVATLSANNSTISVPMLSGNGSSFSASGQVLSNGNITLGTAISQPGVIGSYYCTSQLVKQ
jgi:trimeric autotransporter adhesin